MEEAWQVAAVPGEGELAVGHVEPLGRFVVDEPAGVAHLVTGIPDFFSQMGAFLRSVSPVAGWRGEKLPNLKPWVKAVFAGYIVVTIPVLAALVFLLVVRLPRILETIWDSFFVQAAAFSDALGNASPLLATASGLQMLILALQLLAIAYLLGGLGLRLIRATWNWSRKAAALFT